MIDKTRAPPNSRNEDFSFWSLVFALRQRKSASPDEDSRVVATIKDETFHDYGREWRSGESEI